MNRGRVRLIGAFAVAALLAMLLLVRVPPVTEPGPSGPARDRVAALAIADSIRAAETSSINPECHTRVLSSADTTGRAPVVVFLHGFTNCPKQFDRLAAEFSSRGYSVVTPLLPRHGQADRMTSELSDLTGEELVRSGERAVDIAHGLGRPVIVVGLSAGAVLAAWLAQHRDDVDAAVLLAPSFAPRRVPRLAVRYLTAAMLAAPDVHCWWDAKLRERVPGPKQCYPGFYSHGLAQTYRLGLAVMAGGAPPKAKTVWVTSAADDAVNNELNAELVAQWHGKRFQFPANLGVHHDMIDPEQPYQRTEVVYPVLVKLVDEAAGR